jgi:hypothetical protein
LPVLPKVVKGELASYPYMTWNTVHSPQSAKQQVPLQPTFYPFPPLALSPTTTLPPSLLSLSLFFYTTTPLPHTLF